MLIGLKGNNYYSKVFKRVNYKLSNSTFWVVIMEYDRSRVTHIHIDIYLFLRYRIKFDFDLMIYTGANPSQRVYIGT